MCHIHENEQRWIVFRLITSSQWLACCAHTHWPPSRLCFVGGERAFHGPFSNKVFSASFKNCTVKWGSDCLCFSYCLRANILAQRMHQHNVQLFGLCPCLWSPLVCLRDFYFLNVCLSLFPVGLFDIHKPFLFMTNCWSLLFFETIDGKKWAVVDSQPLWKLR